jgi:hypothetical protein
VSARRLNVAPGIGWVNAERTGFRALIDGGIYLVSPPEAAYGAVIQVSTLVQSDGDVVICVHPDVLGDTTGILEAHFQRVRAELDRLRPLRGKESLLNKLMWTGPVVEAGLVGWELGTEGWQPGRLLELLWQSGWALGPVLLTGVGWLSRRLLARRMRALLNESSTPESGSTS